MLMHKGDLGSQMYLLEEGAVAVQLPDARIELDQRFFGSVFPAPPFLRSACANDASLPCALSAAALLH